MSDPRLDGNAKKVYWVRSH